MSAGFVLVASYPKSGNTWTRIVLERLHRGAGLPFSINDLDAKYHGILRRFAFDSRVPANASDLLPEEIDGFLSDLYRRLNCEIDGTVFLKVHDAAKKNFYGEWLYPPDCIRSVIYLVRHPFDVAVSTAHHLGISLERAIAVMADDGSARPPYSNLSQSLPQVFGSWSGNVQSWIDNSAYQVSWARYEDIHADPVAHFGRLARAAVGAASAEHVEAAVSATSFEALQREESARGFRERPESSPQFFYQGRPGTGKDILDAAMRDRLVHDHGPTMNRLGYAEDGGVREVSPPE